MNLLKIVFFFITANLLAQDITINKIEPPNWWTGMKLNSIQLMVYGNNLSDFSAEFSPKGPVINEIHPINNSSYSFIDITIPTGMKPGKYELVLKNSISQVKFEYSFLKRENNDNGFQGFSNRDIIYLVMPDRFADGDPSNNKIEGYDDPFDSLKTQKRYGGDIQGLIDKLDYFVDLGVTTLWINPLVENNTFRSYHGYAATDFYNIDPRLGSNALYKELVNKAHTKGIKIIIDHVANHFSDDHPWMKNLPMENWINGSKQKHLNASHHKMVFTDLYSDSSTIKHVEKGWFTDYMPDLNHDNPLIQKYITQNTIWWIESSGLDGVREDTYPYCGQKFMSEWAAAIMNEYPKLNIVGEVWTGEPQFLAGYQKDNLYKHDFNTNLPALTDFGLRDVLVSFLQGNKGIYSVYELLTNDFLYKNPFNLVTFIDNHDVARTMFYAKDNLAKAKIAYTLLFSMRGIPSFLYGSEIGMVGTEDHGELRISFPGGFQIDLRDAFNKDGRTIYENYIYDFISKLIHIRKDNEALSTGKTIHIPPVNETYIYFRISDNQKIMGAINNSNSEQNVDLSELKNILGDGKVLKSLINETETGIPSDYKLKLKPMSAELFLIK
ncbi:MAG: alpha-amylase family glycosyl hydrolase [Melioribacteraceae bacterium]|nr:alpha-amylase family glycosyl hydrolase [Melioribacteraceae bacterium]